MSASAQGTGDAQSTLYLQPSPTTISFICYEGETVTTPLPPGGWLVPGPLRTAGHCRVRYQHCQDWHKVK